MKAFLSVDLDYWNNKSYAGHSGFPVGVFNRLLRANVPIFVVNHHQHLVPRIKQFDFDTLINVDYHSDVADRYSRGENVTLDCGTWVNHIDGYGKHYIWSHPLPICYTHGKGTCHSNHDPFTGDSFVICRWSKVSHRVGYFPRNENIVGIGIAVSEPDYTEPGIVGHFYEWLEKNQKKVELKGSVKQRIKQISWMRLTDKTIGKQGLALFAIGKLRTVKALEKFFWPLYMGPYYEVRKMRKHDVEKMRQAARDCFKRLYGQSAESFLKKKCKRR